VTETKLDLSLLQQQVEQAIADESGERKLPPVHLWNPDFSGDLDMQITHDGRWIHEGGEIKRPSMVTMFSSILWREEDNYFLVTPAEKVGIQVEDVPFYFTDLEIYHGEQGLALIFRSNTEDVVVASAEHPLRVEVDPKTGEPSPYLMVRYGMEGRLNRNVFYQLVEQAEEKEGKLVVNSCGQEFVLGSID